MALTQQLRLNIDVLLDQRFQLLGGQLLVLVLVYSVVDSKFYFRTLGVDLRLLLGNRQFREV